MRRIVRRSARDRLLDEARTRHPGLFLTGSSYRGISVNHCVKEAETSAAMVLDYLASQTETVQEGRR